MARFVDPQPPFGLVPTRKSVTPDAVHATLARTRAGVFDPHFDRALLPGLNPHSREFLQRLFMTEHVAYALTHADMGEVETANFSHAMAYVYGDMLTRLAEGA